MPAIPRVIHQTWKDADVPADMARLAATWRRQHPRWAYRFWDDAALRAFVAERRPALLAAFDGYARAICRVDLARYVVMAELGGLYADLDFECLAPNDALLGTQALLIGLEPPSHLEVAAVRARGLTQLLSPAWIASVPGHPFWDAVLDEAARRAHEPDPLVATGPILLSEVAAAWRGVPKPALVDARLLHPVDKSMFERGDTFDPERWLASTRQAVAVHHWSGSWWRAPVTTQELGDAAVVVREPGSAGTAIRCRLRTGLDSAAWPSVSALMVTARRPALARLAIDGFRAQTYPNRELVIVVDDGDDAFVRHVEALADPRIRLLALPTQRATLGALRNLAAAAASGAYLCQWDDDDLHDPARIECQMRVLRETGADACFLSRWLLWWPARRRLAISTRRLWEGSMLVHRDRLPAYPELRRGEDTPVAEAIAATCRVALLDAPRLYVYVVHGANTFDAAHFEAQWQAATVRFEGAAYRRLRQQLGHRVDLDAQRAALDGVAARSDGDNAPPAVDLAAAFDDDYGLSIAAGTTRAALDAGGVDVAVVPLPLADGAAATSPAAARATRPLRIVHTNPEFVQAALADAEAAPHMRALLDAPYLIGIWAWESPNTFRAEQLRAFAHFDELWAPSAFVRDALASIAPIPVLTMPHAVTAVAADADRAAWSIPPETFVLLTTFDAFSHVARKHPLAAIAAFRMAFDADVRALLIVKTMRLDAAQRGLLDRAIAGDRRIRIVDAVLARAAYRTLLASVDAVVSLHRAEGFGLVLAEAMAAGKPVIASRCAGSLEFMDDDNSLLVDVDPYTLAADDGCYAAGTQWNEPRIAQAAAHMRRLQADPVAAAALGTIAAAHMARHFSAARIGARMRARLIEIAAAMPGLHTTDTVALQKPSPTHPRLRSSPPPRVLVATPMRNAAAHLARHADLLSALDYPVDRLSLVIVEGGSDDATPSLLAARRRQYQERFRRVAVETGGASAALQGARWTPQQQYRRRAAIARARNHALSLALGDADWVLWIDVDVIDYPTTLLDRLLATGADIATPHCVLERGGPSFDLNTFVRDAGAAADDWSLHARDGLVQPPRGVGRRYLDAFRGCAEVRVDAVGATLLLVRADLHRDGLRFPDFSFRGFIETEGFALMAAERGHRMIGLPGDEIIHYRG